MIWKSCKIEIIVKLRIRFCCDFWLIFEVLMLWMCSFVMI